MNRFFRSALFPLVVIVLLVWVASQTLIPHSKSEKKVTLSAVHQRWRGRGTSTTSSSAPSKHSISFTITSEGGKKATVHYPADQAIPADHRHLGEQGHHVRLQGHRRLLVGERVLSRCCRSSS